ncbi:MAG TPA: ribonuclease BN, partial [Mycobacteriales bacterium]|nr:ribonuclease BN [Mycobacteriales bacterium]
MAITARVDRFQRRHPAAGYPLAVAYKFFDDQGNFLTAMITYYAFLSVFPLLLLLISILGYAL